MKRFLIAVCIVAASAFVLPDSADAGGRSRGFRSNGRGFSGLQFNFDAGFGGFGGRRAFIPSRAFGFGNRARLQRFRNFGFRRNQVFVVPFAVDSFYGSGFNSFGYGGGFGGFDTGCGGGSSFGFGFGY